MYNLNQKRGWYMVLFAPFRGITYNLQKFGRDISSLLTPPYDVISEEEQEYYHQINPYNVIRLILGKEKIGDTDWDNKYTRAADLFKKWQKEGILVRAKKPCVYLTCISYEIKGELKHRWGIIGLVKIEDPESKMILPHERTFSAHKEDRLRLMKACSAQLSQVFGLYSDPHNKVIEIVKEKVNLESPLIEFEFRDKTKHKMWIIENEPSLFQKLHELFKEKRIVIADGHHRYETSRNYRDMMRMRYGRNPNRSYEFVMMYLANMEDEGLTVLPSHRLLKKAKNFELNKFLTEIEKFFEVRKSSILEEHEIERVLLKLGKENNAFAFFCHGSEDIYFLSLKESAKDKIGTDVHPALKKLDVLVLSRLIFQKILGFSREDLDNTSIFHYTTDIGRAIDQVRSGKYQMAFLLNPTKIEAIKEITLNSLIMPRKSTYFYPKILTGLVFNKVDPNETIQLP